MSIFLITFFLLYGSLHWYLFLKVKGALSFGTATTIFLVVFLIIMVSAPVIVHVAESYGVQRSARIASYIGYMWMGLAFLFFSFSLVIDLYRFLVFASGLLVQTNLSYLIPSPRFAFFTPLLLATVIALYGYFEALHIRTETVVIRSRKIPKEVGTVTIAQISDVHLGLIVREERLKRILGEIKKASPDIVVSTGDLVDGEICDLGELAGLLSAIKPKYGTFAITGNHEFYAGLDQALRFTEKAGFTILRGEAVCVAGIITIAGIDDQTGKYFNRYQGTSEKALLSGLPREKFTLLLKHRPVVDERAKGLFDLQLSGHTHKGQIFPFNFITGLFYPPERDLHDDCSLYVSRGSGTWGPPIRFLSPPEVTIFKLAPEE